MFLSPKFDPKTQPWYQIITAGLPFFRVYYLQEILNALAIRDPDHLLLDIFFPLICDDEQVLRKDVGTHYKRIRQAVEQDRVGSGAIRAFESWLLVRFNDRQEVDAMITELVPLEESFAGRYLTEKLRPMVEKEVRKKVTQEVRKKVTQEVTQEVTQQVTQEVTQQVSLQYRAKGLQSQLKLLANLHEAGNLTDQEYHAMVQPLEAELASLKVSPVDGLTEENEASR